MWDNLSTSKSDVSVTLIQFQLNQNPRIQHANFFNGHKYEAGKNTLLNRLSHLNHKSEKQWIELSLDSIKVKCKNCF